MAKFKSDFLNEISARGLLYQCSDLDGLDALLASGTPLAAYWGADPTADSLHIGNLAALGLLRWFEKTGGRAMLLVGGATGRIGDPSGRDSERPLLTEEALAANIAGIRKSLGYIFKNDIEVVDNYEWFRDIGYIEFLRRVGKMFSVNEMIKRDSVRIRLEREQPLSFLEFNYSLFQAYDFCELAKRRGVRAQFGGADQWGNLVSGVELARKLGDLPQLFALTTALITDANGVKFGKSMGNAVWLNEDKSSAHDYYQFWRNADDHDVGKLLRIFTDLPLAEIAKLEALAGAEANEAKKILAFEATTICRGEEAAKSAAATAAATFEQGAAGEGLATFEMPGVMGVLDLAVAAGLASSKAAARRLVAGGGLYWDGARVGDEKTVIEKPAKKTLMSAGKKTKVAVV
jgi:tyrosyl-tRNA synthetase